MPANHKRVYRLYREEGLAMRIRQRRRIRWNGAVVKPRASQPNERWSMDFVSDCVSKGKVIRMLTIVDDCTRECPVIEVDTSLGGLRVRRALDRMASALRDECLNANWFTSLSDARRKTETWRQDYNERRPHSSLNYLPPAEFARTATEMRA